MAKMHLTTIAASLALAATTASAGVFADFDADRNSRFIGGNANSSGEFLLAGYDLSGLATSNNGGILISDRHVLTAAHRPSGAYTFVGSDGVSRTYRAARNTVVQTLVDGSLRDSDILIATLDDDNNAGNGEGTGGVSEFIAPMPLLQATAADLNGRIQFVFDQNERVGRNRIVSRIIAEGETEESDLLVVMDDSGNRPTFATAYDFDTTANGGQGGLGGDEIGLVAGDSGHGSLFINDDGVLALLGSHYGVSELVDANTPVDEIPNYFSFSSLAGVDQYLPQITGIIAGDGAADSFSVVLVPEPTGLALLLAPAAALLRRRRA